MFHRKAISSVLAVTLLVLVAILSVVAFNTFFIRYQSHLMVSVEGSTKTDFSPVINALVGTTLYLKNPHENMTINKVEIDSVDCNISGRFYSSLIALNVSPCLIGLSGNSYNVVVITPQNIYQKILSKS